MTRAFIALALLLPGAAHALLGTGFTVTLRDAATGRPVEGAYVVAREFVTVGKFHGSSTFCARADAAIAPAGRAQMQLPGAGVHALRSARAIEAFAYRPGYCLGKTYNGRAASYIRHGPSMGTPPRATVDPSVETVLELRRAVQGADERLLYLAEVAEGLLCNEARWGDASLGAMDRLAEAMLAEATPLAQDRYQKTLVERMRQRLAFARQLPAISEGDEMTGLQLRPVGGDNFPRDFIVGSAEARVSWSASRNMAVVAMPGRMQAAQASPPSGMRYGMPAPAAAAPGPEPSSQPALAIHCRHGAPSACDLDERDADGNTALGMYVANLGLAEAKLLLAAGADPSVPAKPFGAQAIDALLQRMSNLAPDSPEAQTARSLLDLLVSHPKVTLRQALKEDLAADPSTWTMASSARGYALLRDARERLRALPARVEGTPGCAPTGYSNEFTNPPLRLRHPR